MQTMTNDSPTDARFALLELDRDQDPVEVILPAPTVFESPPAVLDADIAPRGTVSAPDRDRAIRDEQVAAANGFTLRVPIYEIGTRVIEIGSENFRKSRAAFEEMPLVASAADRFRGLVAAENRKDYKVEMPSMSMRDDGMLAVSRPGATFALPMSEPGFRDLARYWTGNGGGYLAGVPAPLRARNMNDPHWDGEKTRAGKDGRPVPRELTLRTRRGADGRTEVWSVVSPTYKAHDVDAIADQLGRVFEHDRDARMEVSYDGYRASFDVLYHSDVQPDRVVAGEIFKAGIRVRTADDGSGSIQIRAVVHRNLCLNLIVIDTATQMIGRIRHVGDGIQKAVEAAIRKAQGRVEAFAEAWSAASVEDVLARYDHIDDVEDVFRALVQSRAVRVPGCPADELADRLFRSWQQEPGRSKKDIVNAITRAAHGYEWGWGQSEELEEQAGHLLFARQWRLPAADDRSIEV